MDGTLPLGLQAFVSLALIIQYVVEQLKIFIPEKWHKSGVPLLALGIALMIAFGCKVGFMVAAGLPVDNVKIDYLLTAILLSGGSVVANELIKVVRGVKETMQANAP